MESETLLLENPPVKLLVEGQKANHHHIGPYECQHGVRNQTTASGSREGNGFFCAHDVLILRRFRAPRKSGRFLGWGLRHGSNRFQHPDGHDGAGKTTQKQPPLQGERRVIVQPARQEGLPFEHELAREEDHV